MLEFLADKFLVFAGKDFPTYSWHSNGQKLCTYILYLPDLYMYSSEAEFMQSLLSCDKK